MSNTEADPNRKGVIIINPECTSNCVFCHCVNRTSPDDMRMQEKNAYLNLLEYKKQGITHIEISGADPIQYEHLPNLVSYIKKMGFSFVEVSTHGRGLKDPKLRRKLRDAGVDSYRVPLYGCTKEVHDSITRTPGSFDDTIEGLRRINPVGQRKIRIMIHSLIMDANKNELVGIMHLAKEMGVKQMECSIPFISSEDKTFALPIKDMAPYARELRDESKNEGMNISFHNIPFCVFGEYDISMDNTNVMAELGNHCQPPEVHNSGIRNFPKYRKKRHAQICENCKAKSICAGFIEKDLDAFGTGDLKPLK